MTAAGADVQHCACRPPTELSTFTLNLAELSTFTLNLAMLSTFTLNFQPFAGWGYRAAGGRSSSSGQEPLEGRDQPGSPPLAVSCGQVGAARLFQIL